MVIAALDTDTKRELEGLGIRGWVETIQITASIRWIIQQSELRHEEKNNFYEKHCLVWSYNRVKYSFQSFYLFIYIRERYEVELTSRGQSRTLTIMLQYSFQLFYLCVYITERHKVELFLRAQSTTLAIMPQCYFQSFYLFIYKIIRFLTVFNPNISPKLKVKLQCTRKVTCVIISKNISPILQPKFGEFEYKLSPPQKKSLKCFIYTLHI